MIIQNDSTDPRTPDISEGIINYSPGQVAFDYLRPDAPASVSILPVPQDIVTTQRIETTSVATVTVKKPLTLGSSLVIFIAVIIVLAAGYFAYVTWLA